MQRHSLPPHNQRPPPHHPSNLKAPPMVKLDLGIAKLDWYVLPSPSANTGPFSFLVDHEGIFLLIKPVQLALLWPWVKV